jgi:hypothetical protein
VAKHKPTFDIDSYGIYKGWQDGGKSLPTLKQCTLIIPAEIDIEFGLIMSAKKAKGLIIDWCIEHPNITDKKGKTMAPFEGQEHIRNNDWKFYLGDTIWAPEYDKVGQWRMFISHDSELVAEKTFEVTEECPGMQAEARFWKKRGYCLLNLSRSF